MLLYCVGADGNTCGWKSRGDEKQVIDVERPNLLFWPVWPVHGYLWTLAYSIVN